MSDVLNHGDKVDWRGEQFTVLQANTLAPILSSGGCDYWYTIRKSDDTKSALFYLSKDLKYWFSNTNGHSYGCFVYKKLSLADKVRTVMEKIKAETPEHDCTCFVMSNSKEYDGMHDNRCRRTR